MFLDSKSPTLWGMAAIRTIDSVEYLYRSNSVLKSVDIYQYQNNSFNLSQRIQPPDDEKFRINRLQGFAIGSEGEVYLFLRVNLQRSLKFDGDDFQHFYQKSEDNSPNPMGLFNHVSISIAPTYLIGDELFFVQWPLFHFLILMDYGTFHIPNPFQWKPGSTVYFTPIPGFLNEGL